MRLGKEPRQWMRAAMVGLIMGPAVASAELPVQPLQRAGRVCGIGWGDGYHACASSGVRPLADLPPKSYSATYGAKSHFKLRGISHRMGATYYDRFDAGCDAPSCDSISRDACLPESHGYLPVRAPLDSEAQQFPQVSPIQASPITAEPTRRTSPATAMPPRVQSDSPAINSPTDDPVVELTQPLTHTSPKKYPTRPQPPERLNNSVAMPVASKHKEPALSENAAVVAANEALAAQPAATQSVNTETQASNVLTCPDIPPATPARLKPTRRKPARRKPTSRKPTSLQTLMLNKIMKVRPSMQPDSLSPEPAVVPHAAVSAPPSYLPSYAIAPYDDYLQRVSPDTTETETGETMIPSQVPKYATMPAPEPGYVSPPAPAAGYMTMPVPDPEHATTPAVAPEQFVIQTPIPKQPKAHPVGSVGKTTPIDSPSISVASRKRPMRLEVGGSGLFDSRPIVEMAERSNADSDAVIYQPESGSLK